MSTLALGGGDVPSVRRVIKKWAVDSHWSSEGQLLSTMLPGYLDPAPRCHLRRQDFQRSALSTRQTTRKLHVLGSSAMAYRVDLIPLSHFGPRVHTRRQTDAPIKG